MKSNVTAKPVSRSAPGLDSVAEHVIRAIRVTEARLGGILIEALEDTHIPIGSAVVSTGTSACRVVMALEGIFGDSLAMAILITVIMDGALVRPASLGNEWVAHANEEDGKEDNRSHGGVSGYVLRSLERECLDGVCGAKKKHTMDFGV